MQIVDTLARVRRNARRTLSRAVPRLTGPALALALLCFVIWQWAAPAAALQPGAPNGQFVEVSIFGGRYYPQAGGFAVSDRRGMPFYRGYLALGGVAQLGYPVTRRFYLDGFTCQGMQGGLLQYLPDSNTVVLANTFELLSRYGRDDWLFSLGIPRPIRDDGASSFDEAVQIRLAWLTNAAIAERYLAPPPDWTGAWGSADAVNRYGLPMSQPASFGAFVSQRFQRVAFQSWQQSLPGLPPAGTVTQVLGGDLVRQSGLLGPLAVLPQSPDDDSTVPVDLTVGTRNQLASAGAARQSGQFTYTITSSATGRTFPAAPLVGARPAPPRNGTYVVAIAQAQNAGTKAAAPGAFLQLRDRGGAVYPPLPDLTTLASTTTAQTGPTGVIAPGQTGGVALAYDVPTDSGPWTLEPAPNPTGAQAPTAVPGAAAPDPVEVQEPDPGNAPEPQPEDTPADATPTPMATQPPGPTGPPTATPRTSEQVLPGIVRVKVSEIVRPFLNATSAPPRGQEYVYTTVEIENLSRGDLPYGTSFFYIRARGTLYQGQFLGNPSPLGGGTLAPGGVASGTIAFSVPTGSVISSLVYTVANNQLEVPVP